MRRTRLNQFFQAGNKAYGIANNNAAFTNYSGGTTPTRPTLFDTTEYIGRNSFAEGDVVDKEKVAVVIPVLKKEAVAKFYENNNAGNIKKGTFGGQTWGGKTYQGKKTGIKYRKYDSKEQGLADIINVIQNYNTNDLKKIISKYASDDESGKVYKHYYEDLRKVLPEKINFKDNDQVKNLMKVITSVENEGNSVPPTLYYREEDFDKAVDLYREVREEVNLPIRKPSKEEMARLGFSTGGDVKNDKAKDPAQIARGPEVSGIPRYFGKGEHKVQLAYITDPEAELLKKLDLHDSNPPHTGPSIKNIPNYNDFGDDGEGGTTGGGGGDSREGGVGGDGDGGGSSGGSGGGNTPNDRPNMADIAGPTNTPSTPSGGGGSATPTTPAAPPAKKKKTIGNLYGTYFNTFKNTDFLKDPVKSAFTAYNQGLLSSTNLNAYGFLGGVFGDASLGIQNTLSAENVKDLNFSGTETDVVGNVGTFQNGYDINADYNFGNDTGALSVSKEISLFDKDFTVTGSIDTDGGFTPSITYNYKKGGLLTKRK